MDLTRGLRLKQKIQGGLKQIQFQWLYLYEIQAEILDVYGQACFPLDACIALLIFGNVIVIPCQLVESRRMGRL